MEIMAGGTAVLIIAVSVIIDKARQLKHECLVDDDEMIMF